MRDVGGEGQDFGPLRGETLPEGRAGREPAAIRRRAALLLELRNRGRLMFGLRPPAYETLPPLAEGRQVAEATLSSATGTRSRRVIAVALAEHLRVIPPVDGLVFTSLERKAVNRNSRNQRRNRSRSGCQMRPRHTSPVSTSNASKVI